jgi:hypothetical protein
MAIVPDNHVELQYLYTAPSGSGDGMWTVAWHTGGVTDAADDEALVDAVEALITGQLSDLILLTGIRMVFGTAVPSEPIVREVAASVSGVAASGILLNTAYVVQKRTNLGGRRNRGRLYLPGVVDSAVGTDGTLSSGAQSDLQSAVDLWIEGTEAALLAGGATSPYPCILHADGVGAPPVVQSFAVASRVGTQRRRLTP